MRKHKTWTEDEEIYLEYYLYQGEKSYSNAIEFLERSPRSVWGKTNQLRKKDKSVSYIQKPYSEEEIGFIKKNYKTTPVKIIAKKLGRPEGSIRHKAYELGIKKRVNISDYDSEIKELAKAGFHKSKIAKELGLKTTSVHNYIRRNGIKCEEAPREIFQENAKIWMSTWRW